MARHAKALLLRCGTDPGAPIKAVGTKVSSAIKGKIATVKAQIRQLKQIGIRISEAPDGQISLTDPDARSMATSGRGTGMVGYNVQTAVDAKHHMIVAHEATNVGHDREQLSSMARQARDAMGTNKLTVLADRGYFKGEEILAVRRRVSRHWSPSRKLLITRQWGYSTKQIFATSHRRISIDAPPANMRSGASRRLKLVYRSTSIGPQLAQSVPSKRNARKVHTDVLLAGNTSTYLRRCRNA